MKFIPIALTLAISTICHQQHGFASAFVSPQPPSSLSSTPRHIRQHARAPIHQQTCQLRQQCYGRQFQLFSTTDTTDDLETEIKSMRVSAIKQELESYGISTRTFLEKSELVDALVQARKEGKTPISSSSSATTTTTTSSTSSSASSSSSSDTTTSSTSSTTSSADRQTRIQEEMQKANTQKVSELKSELESLGVSTKSFFEKSEFVRAVAEARVDGVKKSSSKKKKRRAASSDEEEEVEEVKAKVEVITNDSVGPKTKKTRDASDAGAGSNPFGGSPFGAAAGGANPFGGAAGGSPFGGGAGGMGGMDMGSIADMLKGMGGMGGAAGAAGGNPFAGAAGGNPFGGAAGGGANPFGGGAGMADAMKAAQEAMSNPKVRAVVEKAQKNPKVMAAVQECMGNPMAMGKYMSDPEVGPILKELQDAMM